MIKKHSATYFKILGVLTVLYICSLLPSPAFASPYGVGVYGSQVPYGGQTSLTLTTSGNITIPLTPSGSPTLNNGSGTVTVTSTDVKGYNLYIQALGSTALTSSVGTIPASTNTIAGSLATNTWGYTTDGSSNFIGISLTNTLIKSFSGPAESGDTTAVAYGVLVDNSTKAGTYAATVLYTAVPQTN